MNFYSKEEQKSIMSLNKVLGMNYRTTPYDLKNPKDIIEATTMATAEFFDMAHYWSTISIMDENFDESLETFFPAAWMKICKEQTSGKPLLDLAILEISKATKTLYELMKEAEQKCSNAWKLVFIQSNPEVLKHFFGETDLQINMELANEILTERLFEVYSDCEYQHSVEDSALEFVKSLKLYLFSNEAEL